MSDHENTADFEKGDVVWYHPSLGGPGFLGQVDSAPWLLGKTWVVRLRRMEVGYAAETGKPIGTDTVAAAACCALTPLASQVEMATTEARLGESQADANEWKAVVREDQQKIANLEADLSEARRQCWACGQEVQGKSLDAHGLGCLVALGFELGKEAETEVKRLRECLLILDKITDESTQPTGNEPEDICPTVERFVRLREKARQYDIHVYKRSRNIIWCSKGHEILLSPSPVPDYPVLLMVKCGECGEQVRTNEALKKNEDRLKADLEEARKERDDYLAQMDLARGERDILVTHGDTLRTEAKRLREALQEIRECCTTTRKPSTIDTVAHIAGVALSPPTDQASG